MIPARRHMALAALAACCAGTAAAQTGADAWVDDRTRLFSDVCMASAPGFAQLEAHALEAGFEPVGERLLFKEVSVSLKSNGAGSLCACQMSMLAPDFPLLLVSMVDRLNADYPDFRLDDTLPGRGYSAIFTREGEEVILELSPEKFKEHDMLVGWVIAKRACPT